MAKGETESKRLQLLMQPSMYEKLREKAQIEGASFNNFIHCALQDFVVGEAEPPASSTRPEESKGAMATYEVCFHAPIKGPAVMRIEAASEDELWEKVEELRENPAKEMAREFGRMVDVRDIGDIEPAEHIRGFSEEAGRWRLPESLRCRGRGLIDVCRSDLMHAERV